MKHNSEPTRRNSIFPPTAEQAIQLPCLIRQERPLPLADRLSSRLVQIAQQLPEGEYVGMKTIIPKEGLNHFSCFGSQSVSQKDLAWIVAETADAKPLPLDTTNDFLMEDGYLYELVMPIAERNTSGAIGFATDIESVSRKTELVSGNTNNASWLLRFCEPKSYKTIMEVAKEEDGAIFCFFVGSASAKEQQERNRHIEQTWSSVQLSAQEYLGIPVRVRKFVCLPAPPSVRLRAIFNSCLPGIELRFVSDERAWDYPMVGATVLPDYAARILALEPTVSQEPILGVKTRNPTAKPLPACHDDSADPNICIGKAMDISGEERKIYLSENDWGRHRHIIGQTGTGKSTALAKSADDIIKGERAGLTFLDPHGKTIETILRLTDPKDIPRIRYVSLADLKNPVPLCPWPTGDPKAEERTISDITLLIGQLYDPHNQGIVGPRFETLNRIVLQCVLILLGPKASFLSMQILLMNRNYQHKLADAIEPTHPDLAQALRTELADNRSNESNDLASWIGSKYSRMTAVEQLRNSLGAGANALRFSETIDTNTITLIDLAMPTIGTLGASITGALILNQMFSAATQCISPSIPHFCFIDEVQLFQSDQLALYLAQSRKWKLYYTVAHQHMQQLNPGNREAISANTASFSAFRLSPKDAAYVADRFEDPSICQELPRLDAFNSITTLSVGGIQTPSFTLQTEKPVFPPDAEITAQLIKEQSLRTLVEPYRDSRALTADELRTIFNNPKKYLQQRNEITDASTITFPCDQNTTPDYIKRMISYI